uniref:Na+/proline symporter n=1 Tax=Candidatus Kentrum sp. MB TaxID=2138164 RepID=A0A450XH21_9GAMM|nr:MAG: Na+/proline symporter [Candidatus Kentron sp. MB]VFK32870.1 MAG: Na+/proline symporter [Candidatus Kentron sp. MB]VFK75928.1 MAG: Na+/proline symporter [Candidatus Kentron sp. MB]
MTLLLVLLALVVSAGLYGAIAYWKSREIRTVRQLFHIENGRDGALSIVAGNLTLGTGLFYVASLAQSQAIFAIVAPIGVLVGYLILANIAKNLTIEVSGNQHNILDSIRMGAGGRMFYKFLSIIIVLTYLIIIPFEIYVSSSLFASVLPGAQSSDMAIVFATVLFCVVVTYSAIGGLRGIVATDYIQLAFIIVMLLIVLLGAIFLAPKGNLSGKPLGLFPTGGVFAVLALSVSAFVTAVATQMYNIINLTVGSSFDSADQSRLFRIAGIVLFFALLLFVFTGLATRTFGESDLAGIDLLLNQLSKNGESFSWIIFLVVFGMVAVLISTADSGIMAISHFMYSNIFQNDSRSSEGGRKLWVVRLFYIVSLNTIAAIPLILIFKSKPDLVPLLLSSVSALTVAAPFLVSSAINVARFQNCLMFDWKVSVGVIVLILMVWGIAIWRVLEHDTNTGTYLIVGGVFFGLLYYFVDCAHTRRRSYAGSLVS